MTGFRIERETRVPLYGSAQRLRLGFAARLLPFLNSLWGAALVIFFKTLSGFALVDAKIAGGSLESAVTWRIVELIARMTASRIAMSSSSIATEAGSGRSIATPPSVPSSTPS
jgi:hypothetical protein